MPIVLLLVVVAWFVLSRRGNAAPLFGSSGVAGAVPQPDIGTATPTSPVSGTASLYTQSGQLDNLAQAIASLEGFGIPGNRPTRDNNPGDLKSAPGMIGRDAPGSSGIAQFADAGDGWDALNGWITSHTSGHPEWDFYDLTHFYATGDTLGQPAQGEADPDKSAEAIAGYLGVDPTSTVLAALGAA